MKKYLVDGKEFSLVSYDELTIEQESQINAMLGFHAPDDNEISLNVSPEKILPLILLGEKGKVNFKKVSYKVLLEIITDFIVERVNFFYGMPDYLQNSIQQKMKPKKEFIKRSKVN